MKVLLISLATFASTYCGGLLALKLKKKLHLIMGFAAGVVIGVVFFEIFPEIIEQIKIQNFSSISVMAALLSGFLIFHIIEKGILIHHAHESDYAEHVHPQVGILSALALIGHSFLDGFGIGLGYQINPSVGILVALAVISHDFTDGMNTITLMISNKNSERRARQFLFLDAIAPILGVAATLFFSVSAKFLIIYLGFFAGFLIYIGASDILPQAHSKNSSYQLIALTVFGALVAFFLARIA